MSQDQTKIVILRLYDSYCEVMLIFDSSTEVPLPKDFGQFPDVNGVNGRPRMVRTGQCEYVSKSLFFKLNRIILMSATQVSKFKFNALSQRRSSRNLWTIWNPIKK